MKNDLTENYKGYIITVERDQEPMTPDDVGWGENVVFMTTHHRQFHVEAPKYLTNGINYKRWWRFLLYGYIHSGVALSLDNSVYPFNDPWDAAQIGNVFVKKSKQKAPTKDKAEEVAKRYVEAWNQYLNDEVWGYIITDSQGEGVDSCWGFYASNPESVMAEARELVDALIGTNDEL